MNLYVIRHGEVPSNVEKTISGFNNERLTERGIEQALQVKEKIKDIKFAKIFCSPVPRAIQTAEIIVPDKDIYLDNRLAERNPGTMLGHKRSEIDREEWDSLEKEKNIYGGETQLAGIKRAQNLIDELELDFTDENILLITHMFICKSIWMLENNVKDKAKVQKFFQDGSEVKIYKHKRRSL